MDRRSLGLQLSKALVGFLQYKTAEGLSSNTLGNYEHHLKVWLDYAGDVEISQMTWSTNISRARSDSGCT